MDAPIVCEGFVFDSVLSVHHLVEEEKRTVLTAEQNILSFDVN